VSGLPTQSLISTFTKFFSKNMKRIYKVLTINPLQHLFSPVSEKKSGIFYKYPLEG